jgi:hypothetical protein
MQAAQGTKYASQAWAALMAAIAMAESSGNADATNPTDNGGTQTSWGLWQISTGTHAEPSANWNDPIENAKLAIGKLDSQGLRAWGTYNSGAYKQYMSGNVPPQSVTDTGGSASPGGIQTTGFNPFSYINNVIPGFGWIGSLIGGSSGLPSTIGDVATSISGITRAVTKLIQLFMLLFRPDFWLRIGAFVFGLLTMGAAVYFIKEAV